MTLAQSGSVVAQPRILLIGKNGQVGAALYPLLAEVSELLATDRASLDLTRPDSIRECIRSFHPEVIINAAAYTAVDKAEAEPELAAAVNARAPGVLAEEAAKARALLIHYSTDYVFDGMKPEPYVESDPINPLNVYGKTKAAGEQAIRDSACNHLIFRTSWVYSLRGTNFLLTILRLAREREELRIVDDQIGAPTSNESIAQATLQVLKKWRREDHTAVSGYCGTYHLTASGHCSWFDFATEIVRQCAQPLRVQRIVPIPTSAYPTPARRPLNSRLDCSAIAKLFTVSLPSWQDELSNTMRRKEAVMAS